MTASQPVPNTSTPSLSEVEVASRSACLRPLRVLFATDNSVAAAGALGCIQDLAWPAGTAIQVISVIPSADYPLPDWGLAIQQQQANTVVEEAATALHSAGVSVSTDTPRGEIAAEILAAAGAFAADLIVLGSTGRTGLEGFLLGSVARNVAHRADRPELVARHPRNQLRRVLLAVDGSEHSEAALRFATRLPLPAGTEIGVCYVHRPLILVPLDPVDMSAAFAEMITQAEQAAREQARSTVDHACRLLREAGYRPHGIIRDGDPGHQLIHVARELDVDLVIAGARGTSVLKGLGIGSVADRLLKSLPASVLLVRNPS